MNEQVESRLGVPEALPEGHSLRGYFPMNRDDPPTPSCQPETKQHFRHFLNVACECGLIKMEQAL